MTGRNISSRVVLVGVVAALAAAPPVITVEPGELTKRADLLGKEVSVEDRVRLFQLHPGRKIDEVLLKRTPVVFRLPPHLRFARSPDAPAARLQGILRRAGDQWTVDVTALELFPNDLERLNREVSPLPVTEYHRRASWALWAEKRGRDFDDKELVRRARELAAEAIRIEAERPAADPGRHWLQLAERGRAQHLPEPDPSALAHRGFRRRLEESRGVPALQGLLGELTGFFPLGATRVPPKADLAPWERPYAANPASAYRAAPPMVRAALDRRLWADAAQRLLEAQAAAAPHDTLEIAGQAATQLPDRPEVAKRLLEEGMSTAALKVGTLRLREVESLAAIYRERLGQPDRAAKLLRDWLDDQRQHHLSPTDAEGRITLASQYERLGADRATAVELLREAWTLDPGSKEVADAFRRQNFRKVNEEWVELTHNRQDPQAPASETRATASAPGSTRLRGKTPREVQTLLGGKPNRIVYSATQGQLIEQWIFLGTKQTQYINFVHANPESTPTVVASYSLPRTPSHAPAP